MSVIFQAGYTLPGGDQPLTHARIAHAGNWLAGGTATASSTAPDFYENAPLNTLTDDLWKPNTTGFETWEYDHGAPAQCDYCCIGGHTIGSTGSELYISYHNGTTWIPLANSATITTDQDIFAFFGQVTPQRLRIATQNGTEPPSIAVVKFGMALQMRRPTFDGHVPVDMAREPKLSANVSDTGEFLGRTVRHSTITQTFPWQHLPQDWVYAEFPGLIRALEKEPFFIAWRPGEYQDVAFGQTTGPVKPVHVAGTTLMNVTIEMQARAWD